MKICTLVCCRETDEIIPAAECFGACADWERFWKAVELPPFCGKRSSSGSSAAFIAESLEDSGVVPVSPATPKGNRGNRDPRCGDPELVENPKPGFPIDVTYAYDVAAQASHDVTGRKWSRAESGKLLKFKKKKKVFVYFDLQVFAA